MIGFVGNICLGGNHFEKSANTLERESRHVCLRFFEGHDEYGVYGELYIHGQFDNNNHIGYLNFFDVKQRLRLLVLILHLTKKN